jgi:hypothetical protein
VRNVAQSVIQQGYAVYTLEPDAALSTSASRTGDRGAE